MKYFTLVAFLWIMLEKNDEGIGKCDKGIFTGQKFRIIIKKKKMENVVKGR